MVISMFVCGFVVAYTRGPLLALVLTAGLPVMAFGATLFAWAL
jgi:hypothetical protein